MKVFSKLLAAGCLLCAAPLVQACDVRHHGESGDCYFNQMDKNGDGAISKKEFDAFHSEHFKALDANHDGKLTQDEMDGAHKKMSKHDVDPFDRRFEESDIDHDGALSKDEAEIGMPMLFAHFDEFDMNKDGKITKAEVIDSMKKMHDVHEDKDVKDQGQK